MPYATVQEWLDEVENWATRRERLGDDIQAARPITPWLETAWRLGGEAERAKRAELEMMLRDVHDPLLISAALLRKHGYNETADTVQAAYDKVAALGSGPVQ